MKPEELIKGELYYCNHLKTTVKYCGTQNYEGKTYYNFWEAGIGLFYWLEPEEVSIP
jgi:hypothetical protein